MSNNRLYVVNTKTKVYCMISKIFAKDIYDVWNGEKLYYFMKYNKNEDLIIGYENDYYFDDCYISGGINFEFTKDMRKEKLLKITNKQIGKK